MLVSQIAAVMLIAQNAAAPAPAGVVAQVIDAGTGQVDAALTLCDQTVTAAEVIVDETTHQFVLDVTLTPQAGEALATLTRAHIGRAMTLTLGAEIVSEPIIVEAITSGQFRIAGSDGAPPSRLRDAMRGPCGSEQRTP